MKPEIKLDPKSERQLAKYLERVVEKAGGNAAANALLPAGRIMRKAVFLAAPIGETRKLRNSVKVKPRKATADKDAVVFVAVDRRAALAVSAKYPKGFPYVHFVASPNARGAKADEFVKRGYQAAYNAAADAAVEELAKLYQRTIDQTGGTAT